MIRLYLSLILSLLVSVSFAQKKEIQQARDNVKAGKNLEQVEKSMLKLLEDSAQGATQTVPSLPVSLSFSMAIRVYSLAACSAESSLSSNVVSEKAWFVAVSSIFSMLFMVALLRLLLK